jgi:putative tryptophan/tyrosine transport system substrate-binding protein
MQIVKRREFIRVLASVAALGPIAVRAQQAIPLIGFMSGRAPETDTHLVAAVREGLREQGFVEGHNLAIEFRWARGDYERLPALAAELVALRVAVLAALGGDSSGMAAKQATSTIPVVFGGGGDPVKGGLVESFGRPGGNLTGYTLLTNQMESKRVGLLHELLPSVGVFGALINPRFDPAARQLQQIEDATRTLGVQVFAANASNDAELDEACASLVRQRVGAFMVAADPYFDTRRDKIVTFAAQARLPAIYHFREFAVAGGLISYGPVITEMYKNAGAYVGRILHGVKPADLPVLQPTKFELVINVKTASALNLAIPNSMQLLADEVIE